MFTTTFGSSDERRHAGASGIRTSATRGLRTGPARTAGRWAVTVLAMAVLAGTTGMEGAASQEPGAAQGDTLRGAEVEARVVDAVSGDPLVGVLVRAGSRVLRTDEEGRFRMALPVRARHLELRRPGYQPVDLEVGSLDGDIHMAPAPFKLASLAVRSERRAELAEGTALDVETVDGHELHHSGGTSVAEGLAGVAGLSVERPGSWGARPVLRGLGGERVAVMVDGARVNRACVFGMDEGLATVDPASVERVELVQGPGSALFGSGNVGGVINVVTNSGPEDEDRWGEARASASSAVPGASLGGTAGARWGSAWLSVLGDLAAYGDFRSGDGRVDDTSYRQGTAELEAGLEPAPDHRLDLSAQLYEARDIGWPAHGEAGIPREGRRSAAVDWAWQRGGLLDGLSARGYVQRLDHEMYARMGMDHAASTTDARSHTTTSGLRLQGRLLPDRRAHLDVGMEATRLDAEGTRWTETREGPDGTPEQVTLRSWPAVSLLEAGLFAQGEWRVRGATAFTGGFRVERVRRDADDRPTAREWVPSGNVGLRAPFFGPLSLRSSVGWGYRTPDATELYGLAFRPDGYAYQGNPDVKTERGRNVEASLVLDTGPFSATATVYQNDLSELIIPEPVHGEEVSGRPVRRYANVDEARLRGVSASARWRHRPWTVDGSAGYVRGTDRADGTPLPDMPPLEGSLAVRRDLGSAGGWIETELQGALRQDRVASELREPATPGYAVAGIRGGFEVRGTEVVVGVENLADRAYRSHLDPDALLRPGRNFHVRVTRSF